MCNLGGNQYLLLAGIVLDHRKEESALDRADMYVQHGSNRHIRKQEKAGSCVSSGKMAAYHGRGWLI